MKFGICMEGCEEGFAEVVRAGIRNPLEHEFFRYLEIGVAGGHTLAAVTGIVREECAAGRDYGYKRWVTVGVDLPAATGAGLGYGYALGVESVRGMLPELAVSEGAPGALEYGRPHLVLADGAAMLGRDWRLEWDLDVVFIDGCHGKACVRRDFEAVSRYVVPGGYVIFHDAGEREQGSHWQPHCGEGIRVREALRELGLMERGAWSMEHGAWSREQGAGSGEREAKLRSGWRWVREIAGDAGRGGHSCVVVQREQG